MPVHASRARHSRSLLNLCSREVACYSPTSVGPCWSSIPCVLLRHRSRVRAPHEQQQPNLWYRRGLRLVFSFDFEPHENHCAGRIAIERFKIARQPVKTHESTDAELGVISTEKVVNSADCKFVYGLNGRWREIE